MLADSAWFQLLDSAARNPEVTFGALASTASFFISHNVPWSVVAFGTVFSLFQENSSNATSSSANDDAPAMVDTKEEEEQVVETPTEAAVEIETVEEEETIVAVETSPTKTTEEVAVEAAKREEEILKQELEVLRLELLDRLKAEEEAAAALARAEATDAKKTKDEETVPNGVEPTETASKAVPDGWFKETTTAIPSKQEETIAVVNDNRKPQQLKDDEKLAEAVAVKQKLQARVKIEPQQLTKKEIALQEKYAAIESVEDRAYEILKDLGMVGKK